MMHKKRTYQDPLGEDGIRKSYERDRANAIAGAWPEIPPADADIFLMLASMIAGHRTWTTCSAFRVGTLTLLNDATSEDGAQEYAVFRDGVQVESLTCSWMKADGLASVLRKLSAGEDLEAMGCRLADLRVGEPHHPAHGTCARCA